MKELFIFSTALSTQLRFRRIFGWLLIGVGTYLLAQGWKRGGTNLDEIYLLLVEVMAFKVVALASAVFTTTIINQEVEQKTIAYILTRPVDRWKLLLARYAASVVVVTIIGWIGVLGAALGVFGVGFTSEPYWMKDMVAVFFGAVGYGALFLFVSLLVNKAMALCLVFAFGWETAVPNMPGEMYFLSVFSHIKAMADHPATSPEGPLALFSGSLGTSTLTPGTSTAVLLLMSGFLVAASCLWFNNFEYVPREDVS